MYKVWESKLIDKFKDSYFWVDYDKRNCFFKSFN